MLIFEPHLAEKVFEGFVTENNITVYRNISVQDVNYDELKTILENRKQILTNKE